MAFLTELCPHIIMIVMMMFTVVQTLIWYMYHGLEARPHDTCNGTGELSHRPPASDYPVLIAESVTV